MSSAEMHKIDPPATDRKRLSELLSASLVCIEMLLTVQSLVNVYSLFHSIMEVHVF
jgi:hypothetical protein